MAGCNAVPNAQEAVWNRTVPRQDFPSAAYILEFMQESRNAGLAGLEIPARTYGDVNYGFCYLDDSETHATQIFNEPYRIITSTSQVQNKVLMHSATEVAELIVEL